MANGKYKVYYTEEELDLDVEKCCYDVLNIFIGEDRFTIEITADCRKLSTAAKRFSEGYKAAVADGVIPATLVEYLRSYHLETLVEDAREMGEPLEYTFYGVEKYPDGTFDSAFVAEDLEDSQYIYLLIPYERNGIKKDFPTVYVDSFTTEKPDYSGNKTLLKGSCKAAVKVAKANIKNLREEISELKADFDKKQAVVDELTGKKERGEYYYEPDLPRAVNLANIASDTLNAKKAELDEFKVALEKAEATLAAIDKPAVEIMTVDDDASSDAFNFALDDKSERGASELYGVSTIDKDFENDNSTDAEGREILDTPPRRKASSVDTIYLNVKVSADTSEELYAFNTFLINMLIENRSCGDESYDPHDIWQPNNIEWLMSFEARATEASYGKLIAYAKEHGFCVYGYVDGEDWDSWRIIVERPETEAEQVGA